MLEHIIKLLSLHRQSSNPTMPLALTFNQITRLLQTAFPPTQYLDQVEVKRSLQELEAQGEVLAGDRNRYCIAPPTVLALDNSDLSCFRFTGDRTYLGIAHQVIEGKPGGEQLNLYPKRYQIHWIKPRLEGAGIRFLSLADSLDDLPQPALPHSSNLLVPWGFDPFQLRQWANGEDIQRYVPKNNTSQNNRWHYPIRENLKNQDLLKLPTGEYLWFQDEQFYELMPDTAILAMFELDRQQECPLKVIWDVAPGRLDLQSVTLPSLYAQRIWRLTEPVEGIYRTRQLRTIEQRSLLEQIMKRLGCVLI